VLIRAGERNDAQKNLAKKSMPLRKAYLRSMIDVIDAQIRMRSSRDVFERAILAGRPPGGRNWFADEYQVARHSE
jgi:hypothetical protein